MVDPTGMRHNWIIIFDKPENNDAEWSCMTFSDRDAAAARAQQFEGSGTVCVLVQGGKLVEEFRRVRKATPRRRRTDPK